MPWKQEWVDPEIAFRVKIDDESQDNLFVFHAYKDNWFHERYTFWYNLSVNGDEEYEFDIRDVPRREGVLEPDDIQRKDNFIDECRDILIAFLKHDNYFERVINGHSIDDLVSHYEKNHRNFGCSE